MQRLRNALQNCITRLYQSRWSDLWLALGTTATIIILGFTFGWENGRVTAVAQYPGFHYTVEPHNPLSFMASWDAVDYISIARHGYTSLFWVNWFPLYPLTIAILDFLSPSPLISGFLVSWASLVGALYFYIKIVRRLFTIQDVLEPLRAVLFFILFPAAVFFIAPFSESLFTLFALGAIYNALQKRYLWTALLTIGATATHITGVFILIIVGLILIEERGQAKKIAMTVTFGSLGLIAYMMYLYTHYQEPLAFLETQKTYHDWTHHDWLNIITSASPSNILGVALIIMSAFYWWGRRKSFSIYVLLFLLIPLIGHQYGGFNRYILMAFPIPLMIYSYLRQKNLPYLGAAIFTSMLWIYTLLQYAGGYIGS